MAAASSAHAAAVQRPSKASGTASVANTTPSGEEGLDQQAQAVAAALQQAAGEYKVESRQQRGAERSAVLELAHQPVLQAEGCQRRAEDQGGIDRRSQRHRLMPRIEYRHRDVHQEEQHQERLGAGEQFRPIEARTPGRPDDEGEREAGDIELPPGSLQAIASTPALSSA